MSDLPKIRERMAVLEEKLEKSANTLGKDAGLGNKTVDNWMDKPVDYSTNSLEIFLNYYSVNRDWWLTGKGEPLLKNHTQMSKSANGTENSIKGKLEAYQDLIEGRTDYRVIPSAILTDYDIVPKGEREDKKYMISLIMESNKTDKDRLIEMHELKEKVLQKELKDKITELETKKSELARLQSDFDKLKKERDDLEKRVVAKK